MYADSLVYDNKAIAVGVTGDANNLTNYLIKEYGKKPEPKPECFIIQLARSSLKSHKFDRHEFCVLLEALTDGVLETTKYQGASLRLPVRPYVMVFSNETIPPAWKTEHLMTSDRWAEKVLGDLTAADIKSIEDFEAFKESLQTRPAVDFLGFN